MNVVPLHKTPNKTEAEIIIRELVSKGLIVWSAHAKKRMREREINMQQVLTCLAKGRVVDLPVLSNKNDKTGGYDITIERIAAGDYLRIGVCLRFSQEALIVTAIKLK